jgi:asparagine synthase (glutamine-hydrolysing)
MCGISGVVGGNPSVDRRVLDDQLALLKHRGPDAQGAFVRDGAGIAQNRLAIIDLATGDPPITNEDGSIGVVLNGEIYNYRVLRRALLDRGHEFRSQGDTEVIAHLAEELSPVELCRRLDGMFALAVWDAGRGRLVLGRDRLGKKPLYFWTSGGVLVFASEIKAVLAHPAVPRRLYERAIPAYLTFGYVPTPFTFYEGVQSLPPGHVLSMSPGAEPVIERYWSPPLRRAGEREDVSLSSAADRVRAGLTAAVERRLVADVPLGAFLSGGIDSSAVVAAMSTLVDRPVRTFTIGFDDEEGHDERAWARLVANRYGSEHTEFVVRPEAVDLVERLVWHHDQPFGDSSAIPTFLLSELTRQHVTVALSGDGGDELFAGYERFAAARMLTGYLRLPRLTRAAVRSILARIPADRARGRLGSAQRFVTRAELGLPGAYLAWLSYVPEEARRSLLSDPDPWAIADYERLWAESDGAETLDRLLDLNLRTYLLDDLLVKMDRMSMAHGLEVRSPFLDVELLDCAAGLPPSLKQRGPRLKRVLRVALRDLLPEETLKRGKRGFGVPLNRWFRTDLKQYMESMLGAPSARLRSHLSPAAVDALLAEHQSGRRDHGHALWALLTLEVFLRREGW